MANSKRIGNDYERETAKNLSKWFTGSEDKLVCWRHVSSGSIGTLRKKKGQSGENVDGDFQCIDPKYSDFFKMFYMDSKSLSNINLFVTNLKNQKSNQLLNEWKKVVSDAGVKIPIMFVKVRKDRSIPEFVMFHENTVKIHADNFIGIAFKDPTYNFVLLTQEEFFKYNNWEEMVKNCKKD